MSLAVPSSETSTSNTNKIIIASVCTLGVAGAIYYVYKTFKPKDKKKKKQKEDETLDLTVETNNSKRSGRSRRSNHSFRDFTLQVTNIISIEISSRNFPKLLQEEKKKNENSPQNQRSLILISEEMKELINKNSHKKEYFSDKEIIEVDKNKKEKDAIMKFESHKDMKKKECVSEFHPHPKFDESLLNLVNDLTKVEHNHHKDKDLSISIDGNFFLPNDSNNNFEIGYEEDEDEDEENQGDQHIIKKKKHQHHTRNKLQKKSIKSPPEFDNNRIRTQEEIDQIVNKSEKNTEMKISLPYYEKEVKDQEGNVTKIKVIVDDQFLILLKFLYSELNQTLIEMFDSFLEERRKLFLKDMETYISVVKTYLVNKEEYFICVLYNIKNKLNIAQEILDNSFNYYMNILDDNTQKSLEIKEACNNVFHAGIKYAITPKKLTKEKLKEILQYQCDKYDELINEYKEYEPDIIEIMVIDYVYLEFGLDREAIKSSIKKMNLRNDSDFSDILSRIETFQNTSFLN